MKKLEKRFDQICNEVGNITVEDVTYGSGDFEKWAKHSLAFWYEIENPINLLENKKFVENELESLKQLVKDKKSNEVFYL